MKDLKQFIKTTIREFLNENENSKIKYIEGVVEEAKNKFMNRIKIFTNIDFEWLEGNNFVGEYEYDSSLNGKPKIYLYKYYILSLPDDKIEFAINTTIFHELGHAMTNIDHYYIFKPDENILQYKDEEDYVEDFAFNFEMFDKVPDEILELSELFRNKKWIGTEQKLNDVFLYVFDKNKNIIAYNIPENNTKELNKHLYDEYGNNRGGYGVQVIDGEYYKFDSLKSAQDWYSQKENKNIIKKTKNEKYKVLSNIALNIRNLKNINFQDINRGSCFKFAKEIAKLGYDKFTFIFSEEDQEVIHVYIKLNNNLYWDVIGFHSKNDVIEDYEVGDNYNMFDSDLSELERYCNIDTYQSLTTIPINNTEWNEILTIIKSSKNSV